MAEGGREECSRCHHLMEDCRCPDEQQKGGGEKASQKRLITHEFIDRFRTWGTVMSVLYNERVDLGPPQMVGGDFQYKVELEVVLEVKYPTIQAVSVAELFEQAMQSGKAFEVHGFGWAMTDIVYSAEVDQTQPMAMTSATMTFRGGNIANLEPDRLRQRDGGPADNSGRRGTPGNLAG